MHLSVFTQGSPKVRGKEVKGEKTARFNVMKIPGLSPGYPK